MKLGTLCFGKEDESSFSNESRLRDEVRKENEVLFDPFAIARVSEEAQSASKNNVNNVFK